MPEEYKNMTPLNRPRGVSNRNAALDFIRRNVNSGVFFFADDDNTYDYRLFEQVVIFFLLFFKIVSMIIFFKFFP
jgi:beta-1,3-glucuronyltransferase